MVLEENRIAREVVDAALKLHRHFGPGIYESVYEPVLIYELRKRSLTTRQQTPVPLVYEGITFDIGFKTDVVVNELVILELKSVEKLEPVHFKQLLTYLRSYRASARTLDQLRRESPQKRYSSSR